MLEEEAKWTSEANGPVGLLQGSSKASQGSPPKGFIGSCMALQAAFSHTSQSWTPGKQKAFWASFDGSELGPGAGPWRQNRRAATHLRERSKKYVALPEGPEWVRLPTPLRAGPWSRAGIHGPGGDLRPEKERADTPSHL